MAKKEPTNKDSKTSKFGSNALVLALIFAFSALICQWIYLYYRDNPLKFPDGTQVYTVEAGELNLLPNEQTNYLGTRAGEDDAREFLYRANSMYLKAASAFSIRSGPGVYYQSIGRMYYGRDVHVIATCDENDWYMIEFYGDTAYVHCACLFDKLPEITNHVDDSELIILGSRSDEDLEIWGSEVTDETDETDTQGPDSTEPTAGGTTSTPTPTPTPAPTQAPSVNSPSDPVMLELFNLVNNTRAEHGLSPLSWNSSLAADAAVRAQEIVVSFSHTRPDGSDWWTVDPDRMYGENLASGQSTAQEVFNSWMASPGHRANILGDYTTCGFALYYGGDAGSTYYWAQEFGY